MQTNEAIELWKKLEITECNMEFSCGGDSMNETQFHFYTANKNKKKKNEPSIVEVQSDELDSYFDREVYNNVDFYVNSDGHYIGEAGQVRITLEDDEESFCYAKSATSEFCERGSEVMELKLTTEEVDFVTKYVQNINGGEGEVIINYKKDFIIDDKLQEVIDNLETKIDENTRDFEPSNPLGERNDFYTFTTNDESEELEQLTLEGNKLKVIVSNEYYVYSESTD